MNISTAAIETAIANHTAALDAKRAELHKVALGEIVVRNPQFHMEQLSQEVTRQQGIIQGLTIAIVDIKAQQEGYAAVEAERAVVEDFPRTERIYMSAEAAAVREAAAYLERITRKGMVPRSSILEDLEAVAVRMEQGMTARGSTRTVSGPQIDAEEREPLRPPCGARNPQIAGGMPCIQEQGHLSEANGVEPHISIYQGRAYEWMAGGR